MNAQYGAPADNEDQHLGPKIYTVSDVLCELEQVKRELYNQIQLTQELTKEKKNLSSQVA